MATMCATSKDAKSSQTPHNKRVSRARFVRALSVASLLFSASLFGLVCPGRAYAEVLHMPVGGRPIALGEGRVACGAPTLASGFVFEQGGRYVRPPTDPEFIGKPFELKVARSVAECASTTRTVTLIATDDLPSFDAESIVFWADEGHLDARGTNLSGVTIVWQSGTQSGQNVCYSPERINRREHCVWGTARELSADRDITTFRFFPRGAQPGPDAVVFDAQGRRLRPEQLTLVPERVYISRMVRPDPAVDLSSGRGELPLIHPEALVDADCGPLPCELVAGRLTVRGASSLVSSIDVRMRFAPHVFLMRKNTPESQVTVRFAVLHCPMSIASGLPVRHNEEAKVVVRLQGGCARDLGSVEFVSQNGPLKPLSTANDQTASYVLLRLGVFGEDTLTITARRQTAEGPIVLAVANTPTRAAPAVRSSLELPGFPNINFIPTNRPATVHVSVAGEHEHFAVLPILGVYEVGRTPDGKNTVRGDPNAAGLTELRFGLRANNLPDELRQVNLAVVRDPLQRSVHQANIPAPISTTLEGPKPLIEVLCGDEKKPVKLSTGVTAHLPYSMRDTCRVIFHRQRLSPEYGTQRLRFEIEVLRADGSARGEGHVSEVLTFRSGSEPRVAFIRGVMAPFDRFLVRVSHEADELHYIGADEIRTGAPAAQWSAVLGTSRVRLYGTTAIPTGLYRFGHRDYSGVLSLNFGVISRLTWLDPEGQEGFIGAEAGILVIGLANSESQTGHSLSQIGAVAGVGVAVPIANRSTPTQASINVHAWFQAALNADDPKSRYAFIFGPSISIGNVGTNL